MYVFSGVLVVFTRDMHVAESGRYSTRCWIVVKRARYLLHSRSGSSPGVGGLILQP